MTTMAGLRARVRLRLEETTEALWSDDVIDEAIGAALEEYNHLFPREERLPLAHSGGAGPVELTGETVGIVRVVLANGRVVPRRSIASGSPSGEVLAWEWFAGGLHFNRAIEAQSLDVWRLTPFSLEQVPVWDGGLLVLGGLWRTLQQRSVQEVKRGPMLGGMADREVVRAAGREYTRALNLRRRRVRSRLMEAR
jgi:hypothetical protein